MIRFTKALALVATLLALPSMASALGIEIAAITGGGADGTLETNETITFDLRITYDGTEPSIWGLSADLTGMDLPDALAVRDFGLGLAGGSSVTEAVGEDVLLDGSLIDGAIQNNNGAVPVERYVVNHLSPTAYTVNMFDGVLLGGGNGDGSGDYGLGGALTSGGDIHFQVTLENVFTTETAVAFANLQFSLLALDQNGTQIASSGANFALTVIPEPGTALLMGLGLAGLTTIRRR